MENYKKVYFNYFVWYKLSSDYINEINRNIEIKKIMIEGINNL